jgi:hypothetical protein
MLIKVTSVGDVETKKEGKRRWKEIRIDYATADKDDNYKILLDWANPDAYSEAQDCLEDQFYDVKVVKNGKFWNWESISESDETEFDSSTKTKSYSKATESKGGTDWAAKNKLDADRFEFEKEKQGLIVRQSCIGYAIAALGQGFSPDKYIALASEFEDQVMDGFVVSPANIPAKSPVPVKKLPVKEKDQYHDDINDDIPF